MVWRLYVICLCQVSELILMSKSMLIDTTHAEETRVVVLNGQNIEEFDFEIATRKQLRGNIYLAKVTRVEPSLQAAFIEYGGNRHGFLAFNEIHPDYFQIPIADREVLMAELEAQSQSQNDPIDDDEDGDDEGDDIPENEYRIRQHLSRRYKIQEVIKRRQIMLVQVVKEERGNKGAALTTYLSIAGRYGVLMPNTARGGGISRKITNSTDRKRLKSVISSLDVPNGMGLIVRTAGAKRTKQEIKRDYEYLLRVWENIRETTLNSNAPALIYEEEDLVKRAIRDMFDKDFETVLVEGDQGYRSAKEFIRMLMPSQAKKVQSYRGSMPLFSRFGVEDSLSTIHSPTVALKSGGYLVINQTEALVAIDVNSGKSTKERNIESTALKTNLEAADEAARQMRLRDLAGLVIIDFIDMEEAKNNRLVENRLKDAISEDRARIQMGKISSFGLMEISRQRRRTGLLEGTTVICPHCEGLGRLRSADSAALSILRKLDLEAMQNGAGTVSLRLSKDVALYILNEKQQHLSTIRIEWGLKVIIEIDDDYKLMENTITRTVFSHEVEFTPPVRTEVIIPDFNDSFEDDDVDEDEEESEAHIGDEDTTEQQEFEPREQLNGRRRRRRGKGRDRDGTEDLKTVQKTPSEDDAEDDQEADQFRRRRRRNRKGGRRYGNDSRTFDTYFWTRVRTPSLDAPYVWISPFGQNERFVKNTQNDLPQDPLEVVLLDMTDKSLGNMNEGIIPLSLVEPTDGLKPQSLVPDLDKNQEQEEKNKRSNRRKRPSAGGSSVTSDIDPEGVEEVAQELEVKKKPRRRTARGEKIETSDVPIADFSQEELTIDTPQTQTVETISVIEKPIIVEENQIKQTEPVFDAAEISEPPTQKKKGWWNR